MQMYQSNQVFLTTVDIMDEVQIVILEAQHELSTLPLLLLKGNATDWLQLHSNQIMLSYYNVRFL
jgi:hypothetical protein